RRWWTPARCPKTITRSCCAIGLLVAIKSRCGFAPVLCGQGAAESMPLSSTSETIEERASGDPNDFPVVGIGASAGGLDAFARLLRNLPANTGCAFVLIQH